MKSLAITIEKSDLSYLETAIKRRHRIVHRADRIDKDGNIGQVASIQATFVLKWVQDVEQFVESVFDAI